MFGYHKAKRERAKSKQDKADFAKEKDQYSPIKQQEEAKANEAMKVAANENAKNLKGQREEDYASGKKRAEELFSREVQGLTPEQRRMKETTGKKNLNRSMQGYERQLLAKQGKSGIKGGAAYAQSADLARMGQESQGQLINDIESLDADLALKKLAAMFNIEQGEAAQGLTERQMAQDALELDAEKKRQKMLEDKFYGAFTKV